MKTKDNKDLTLEVLDKLAEKIGNANKEQLDRIEAEVNFVKQDVRDIKIDHFRP